MILKWLFWFSAFRFSFISFCGAQEGKNYILENCSLYWRKGVKREKRQKNPRLGKPEKKFRVSQLEIFYIIPANKLKRDFKVKFNLSQT